MMKPKQKKVVSVYVRADLVRKAKQKAQKEGRSLSNWIEQLLLREAA